MSGLTSSYRKEIFDFLRTVIIKFDPFANVMGQIDMQLNGIDNPHGTWNSYYLNISGEYSPSDTRMTVYSSEEGRTIPFDKDIHKLYPKTAALYKVTNKEYQLLEERYPNNRGLIQAIAYPSAMTIDQIIEAPNLSIISCDTSLLHSNERESIMSALTDYLYMVATRWWVPEYSYENMYPLTFWAMLWQSLPAVLFTRRYENIKTPNVHPYHVWEYLLSKGLSDYRDILTDNQSLWLYRNMNYILANKGKHSNLTILAKNILGETFVSLLYKDMFQDNTDMMPRYTEEDLDSTSRSRNYARSVSYSGTTCFTKPEFITYNVVDNSPSDINESFSYINNRMTETGIEYRDSLEYLSNTEESLGTHIFNQLPTKLMEFRKEPIDTSDEQLLVNFLFDTLLYNYHKGFVSYKVPLVDPTTGNTIELQLADAILMYYWCSLKSANIVPEDTPFIYICRMAFQRPVPEVSDTFTMAGVDFNLSSTIDNETMSTLIGTTKPYPFTDINEFMVYAIYEYQNLLNFKNEYEASASQKYRTAMDTYLSQVMCVKGIPVQLTHYETLYEWKNSNESISLLLNAYDNLEDNHADYLKLAESCFDGIFPINADLHEDFKGTSRSIEKMYNAMRDLFIQLCSYNINFLENSREMYEHMDIIEPTFYTQCIQSEYPMFFNIVIEDLDIETVSLVSGLPESYLDIVTAMEGVSLTSVDTGSELHAEVWVDISPSSQSTDIILMNTPIVAEKTSNSVSFDMSVQYGPHVDHKF